VRARLGFTLVELMVAMLIGLMVVGAAYYISRSTGRTFAEQLRRAETQLTLRSAVELLRRDISRAGFGGGGGPHEMPGGTHTGDGVASFGSVGSSSVSISPVPLHAAWVVQNTTTQRQALYISGNLTTSDHYTMSSGGSGLSTSNMVVLQTDNLLFQRSFVNPVGGAFMNTRFVDAFLPLRNTTPTGRMINALNLKTRKSFLRHVTTATGNAGVSPSITVNPPLPSDLPGEGCSAVTSATIVSPISIVRYEVVDTATDADAAAAVAAQGLTTAAQGWMVGGPRSVLVRREIDATTLGSATPSYIQTTTRVVVDFIDPDPALGFVVEVIRDSAGAPQPMPERRADPWNYPPESFRSLVISLVAHSAEQQMGSAIEQGRVAAGRRYARFEVFMPNTSRNPGAR
jgi:prepilin-type N-terminal cleavage/methylation domain-containing protein